MLSSVPKHFNYTLSVKSCYAKINTYFWTFGKFIGYVGSSAISKPEQ